MSVFALEVAKHPKYGHKPVRAYCLAPLAMQLVKAVFILQRCCSFAYFTNADSSSAECCDYILVYYRPIYLVQPSSRRVLANKIRRRYCSFLGST